MLITKTCGIFAIHLGERNSSYAFETSHKEEEINDNKQLKSTTDYDTMKFPIPGTTRKIDHSSSVSTLGPAP